MKFGGTSMGDLERIRRAARIVAAEAAAGKQVAVVVSAMAGKTNELVAWTDGAGPAAQGLTPSDDEYDVVVASGADDLLRWVGTRGTPAIVLVDFWLAEGTAQGLIAQVRAHCPGPPIVVISGDDDPAVMAQARQAGAQGFIHKQAAPDTFGLAVEALLGGLVWFEPGQIGSQPQRSRDLPVTPAELGLSARQGQILALVLQGLPNKRIASQLDIAESTVKEHVTGILERLRVRTRVEAITLLRGRRLELS